MGRFACALAMALRRCIVKAPRAQYVKSTPTARSQAHFYERNALLLPDVSSSSPSSSSSSSSPSSSSSSSSSSPSASSSPASDSTSTAASSSSSSSASHRVRGAGALNDLPTPEKVPQTTNLRDLSDEYASADETAPIVPLFTLLNRDLRLSPTGVLALRYKCLLEGGDPRSIMFEVSASVLRQNHTHAHARRLYNMHAQSAKLFINIANRKKNTLQRFKEGTYLRSFLPSMYDRTVYRCIIVLCCVNIRNQTLHHPS